MNMKRFLSVLLVVALVMSLGGTAAFASSGNRQSRSADDIGYLSENPTFDHILLSLADDLRSMRNEGATDTELANYYNKEMARHSLKRYDLDGYINEQLNSLEQALYDQNPINGLLCMANGVFALGYAEDNYIGDVLLNGNGDAFRHVLWNYGMYCDVGYDFAYDWSEAHEDGASSPALEKQMDKFNNAVGLELGQDNPFTILHSTFVSKSKAKVHDGYCKIISGTTLVWSGSYGEK
jgi:hypothetical protein